MEAYFLSQNFDYYDATSLALKAGFLAFYILKLCNAVVLRSIMM